MSDPLRIALVAEGVTDFVILHAAITAILGERSFVLSMLQPEASVAFSGGGDAGALGGGWRGVYRWCRQAAERSGGAVRNDPLFIAYDLLLVQLDADVASAVPTTDATPDPVLVATLPCEYPCTPPCVQPCPLATATTNALRQALLTWLGEYTTPPNVVLCTPSKSADAWMIAVHFPNDREMRQRGWECHADPASRLAQQPKKQRFSKSQAHYERHAKELTAQWPNLIARMSEAARFDAEFRQVIT